MDRPEAGLHATRQPGLLPLAIGALGIVYGDIGTSPLYAFREAFEGHELEVTSDGVIGACSLTVWALILVISVKYLFLVMRADNNGEGGILALTSLLPRNIGRLSTVLVAFGLFGTAMLYGDGMITPAISVLSAVEGLRIATHSMDHVVVPIAVAILAGLFLIQKRGTAGIGRIFGPIMFAWFVVIGLLGMAQILMNPAILVALSPHKAILFFSEYHLKGFWALGSVFLVVTGGEALYADMGHFGRRPINVGWFSLVFPALALNYLGQGALLLREPEAITSLPHGPRLGDLAPGAAGHGGHGDRLPGAHLRCVLADHPGDAGRLPAPDPGAPHVGVPGRPGVRADRELDPDGGQHWAGHRVPDVEPPGGRLRDRGHPDHGHHHPAVHGGGHPPLALVTDQSAPGASRCPRSSAGARSRWPTSSTRCPAGH